MDKGRRIRVPFIFHCSELLESQSTRKWGSWSVRFRWDLSASLHWFCWLSVCLFRDFRQTTLTLLRLPRVPIDLWDSRALWLNPLSTPTPHRRWISLLESPIERPSCETRNTKNRCEMHGRCTTSELLLKRCFRYASWLCSLCVIPRAFYWACRRHWHKTLT